MQFVAVDLDTLLPLPGAQFIQIGSQLDGDLATFGARASEIIVELPKECGDWPKARIVQASYQDSYVSSPLAARLLVNTIKQIFLHSGSPEAILTVETHPPRQRHARPALADWSRLARCA